MEQTIGGVDYAGGVEGRKDTDERQERGDYPAFVEVFEPDLQI